MRLARDGKDILEVISSDHLPGFPPPYVFPDFFILRVSVRRIFSK